MNRLIVSSTSPITMIGGSDVAPSVLKAALKHAKDVVCADGGADTALWSELEPLAVIGDLDSVSDAARRAYDGKVHHIPEQNSTDFDKVLRSVEAPMIIGVGFLGDRLDHTLAVLHVLLKYRKTPIVLVNEHDVLVLCPPVLRLTLPVGARVSLLPITPTRVETKGLKWEVRDGAMSMGQFIGSSNEAANEEIEIRAMGGLAVIVEPRMLDAMIDAMRAAVPVE